MEKSETNVLPPPPPPTVSFVSLEKVESLVAQLSKEMQETNVRRRFKMCVYIDWCEKMDVIHT